MAVFKCKMCGASLEVDGNVTTCDYCGSQQTLPRISDDKLERLYDRANHFRRNNEFDKAMGIYEQILDENNEDAESYWSIVLCRYGIEYVDDPTTHTRKPTINRAQFTSIFDDDNYKSAIKYADLSQKAIYEREAATINEIQKGILEISQKEEPFDVFICYKETDERGQRTHDSVYANELYHELTREGFKVFFARITLEDKLGIAYEPYIFAALNSAKVMVVIGTKQEYFNAVWVRNEWSRFLSLIKNGERKVLIPAYKDMDPYDLPMEFSHLQAQDMNKLGFMPDLIRGIKKIIGEKKSTDSFATSSRSAETATAKNDGTSNAGGNAATLLRRVSLFLEGGDFESADIYCEKVLDIDPENPKAYIYKMMAQLRFSKEEQLANATTPLDTMMAYKNALRFSDEETAKRLFGYSRTVKERIAEREKERAEKLRIENEQRANAEKERQKRNSLENARNNAQNLVSSQVREKERIAALIAKKQTEINLWKMNSKKMRSYARTVLLTPVLAIILISVFAAVFAATLGQSTVAEAAGPALLIGIIVFITSSIKLLKLCEKPVALFFLNFITYGLFSFGFAIYILNKTKKNKVLEQEVEINSLYAQMQQVEEQIEKSTASLREINQKF